VDVVDIFDLDVEIQVDYLMLLVGLFLMDNLGKDLGLFSFLIAVLFHYLDAFLRFLGDGGFD
jgi:hypothetical protein